jgi:hypothetical protein
MVYDNIRHAANRADHNSERPLRSIRSAGEFGYSKQWSQISAKDSAEDSFAFLVYEYGLDHEWGSSMN